MKGKRFFRVTKKEELKEFEGILRSGECHIDRGFKYLGKDIYMKGFRRVLVHWHSEAKARGDNGVVIPFPRLEELFCSKYPLDLRLTKAMASDYVQVLAVYISVAVCCCRRDPFCHIDSANICPLLTADCCTVYEACP
jgi:hypothetical protein